MATKLRLEQLEGLERRWRDAYAGLVPYLKPGLSPEEARGQVAVLETVQLTDELLMWWGWHDGVGDGPVAMMLPGREFVSLSYAVEMTLSDRDVFELPTYVRLTTDLPNMWAECDPQHPEISRIFTRAFAEDLVLASDSLGSLVEEWTGLLDIEAVTFASDGLPDVDEVKVPMDIYRRGII